MTTAGSNAGGMSGAGGGTAVDITKVWKSDGCGKDYTGPTGNNKGTIDTMGVKDAACNNKLADGTPRCGAWGQPSSEWLKTPLVREYYVYLPQGYDKTKAYPIVFQGPGCGGNGTQVYPLDGNAGNTVIRIGLTPASTDIIGHGCCPFGCFDDKEGDDSVDWVLYENLYDRLNGELCFDRNRVFASGNSSGSWTANELGCKYAGDATRPLRAPMPNTGGLPVPAAEVPTCTNAPMAGMWVHETGDPDNPFTGNIVAINRAMSHNKCTTATYQAAPKENFKIGGGVADDVCKKIMGCDPLYPLVVCELPGNSHGSHDNIANPGFSTFLKLFEAPPLLTP
jgi:poly(3-hydroxybutyrate) depolymerase